MVQGFLLSSILYNINIYKSYEYSIYYIYLDIDVTNDLM